MGTFRRVDEKNDPDVEELQACAVSQGAVPELLHVRDSNSGTPALDTILFYLPKFPMPWQLVTRGLFCLDNDDTAPLSLVKLANFRADATSPTTDTSDFIVCYDNGNSPARKMVKTDLVVACLDDTNTDKWQHW